MITAKTDSLEGPKSILSTSCSLCKLGEAAIGKSRANDKPARVIKFGADVYEQEAKHQKQVENLPRVKQDIQLLHQILAPNDSGHPLESIWKELQQIDVSRIGSCLRLLDFRSLFELSKLCRITLKLEETLNELAKGLLDASGMLIGDAERAKLELKSYASSTARYRISVDMANILWTLRFEAQRAYRLASVREKSNRKKKQKPAFRQPQSGGDLQPSRVGLLEARQTKEDLGPEKAKPTKSWVGQGTGSWKPLSFRDYFMMDEEKSTDWVSSYEAHYDLVVLLGRMLGYIEDSRWSRFKKKSPELKLLFRKSKDLKNYFRISPFFRCSDVERT